MVNPFTPRMAWKTSKASSGVSCVGLITVTLPRTLSSRMKFFPVNSEMNFTTASISASWKFIATVSLSAAAAMDTLRSAAPSHRRGRNRFDMGFSLRFTPLEIKRVLDSPSSSATRDSLALKWIKPALSRGGCFLQRIS